MCYIDNYLPWNPPRKNRHPDLGPPWPYKPYQPPTIPEKKEKLYDIVMKRYQFDYSSCLKSIEYAIQRALSANERGCSIRVEIKDGFDKEILKSKIILNLGDFCVHVVLINEKTASVCISW